MDMPRFFVNVCPLCLCGLLPVVIVCFSAVFQVDYTNRASDAAARLINEMGLSYTVFYTAGIWDPVAEMADSRDPVSEDQMFEVAAAEFDALGGQILLFRNVTAVKAHRIESLKVSPDWQHILFFGELPASHSAISSPAGGMNLWHVDAQVQDSTSVQAVLTEQQILEMESWCNDYAGKVASAESSTEHVSRRRRQSQLTSIARVSGFKHLQVIELSPYRAAFAFDCSPTGADATFDSFTQMAVLDYDPSKLSETKDALTGLEVLESRLTIVNVSAMSDSSVEGDLGEYFVSHACPRFVPSLNGTELLFVSESSVPLPALDDGSELAFRVRPRRRLAQVSIKDDTSSAVLLAWGDQGLPYTAVHGCPEFVPSLYSLPQMAVQGNLVIRPEEQRLLDTFVYVSDSSTSASVLGVTAQELAVSLAEGSPRGRINHVQLLDDVDPAPTGGVLPNGGLNLEGCQPIRAAGEIGELQLRKALGLMWNALEVPTRGPRFTAWLVCLTADQRVAMVESQRRSRWLNMTVPYPDNTKSAWCHPDRMESCFEVWSNPHPNTFS